jgi:hypothetical protein
MGKHQDRIEQLWRDVSSAVSPVVVLTHPSFYYANVGRRKYGQFTGAEAEKGMIADGLKIAFSNRTTETARTAYFEATAAGCLRPLYTASTNISVVHGPVDLPYRVS